MSDGQRPSFPSEETRTPCRQSLALWRGCRSRGWGFQRTGCPGSSIISTDPVISRSWLMPLRRGERSGPRSLGGCFRGDWSLPRSFWGTHSDGFSRRFDPNGKRLLQNPLTTDADAATRFQSPGCGGVAGTQPAASGPCGFGGAALWFAGIGRPASPRLRQCSIPPDADDNTRW